jgi:hypothetical protein
MSADRVSLAGARISRLSPHRNEENEAPGVRGNARLTSLVGLVLLVLLFVEGMTVLGVRQMLSIHVFVGLVIIPPLLLKLASTGYRFARYYLGSPPYRAAGPPQILLRVLAPALVACTIGLFGTGVALLATGPGHGDNWRQLHQVFFFFWFWLMTIHVLAYTQRAFRLGIADFAEGIPGSRFLSGALTRQSLVAGSVCLGVVIAIVLLPWDASWLHWASRFRPDR